ncbi:MULTISPECIES: ABC transporter permease subunit [Pseudoxanthomonas]|uniref:NitT/TauT family transport system permease protein n=1 Tax=Pseudoxanthomonas winnipegensis TaxID=2480810 RepID=A0AAW8GE25_9GAMM|nr:MULTISPECIES: ABC transporter permease subunit [Pseudoxanthomonas]MDQ1120726.1 NitT/TauT family transport system permease protein [Pseudoxanthomonas winnipegensis]MDQ1133950.1 NitT/TauT family transport system permease protein [Pseudoxanthomonas winnipegensis]MDR6139815.1 NitT/TauT family transport system permease protein [Pseudoxanthomonas sp. SORGH_AS_0997]
MSAVATPLRRQPPVRPEYTRSVVPVEAARAIPQARRRPWPDRLRRALVLVVLAVVWEIAARLVGNDLLLPSFLQTARAFYDGLISGELLRRVAASLWVLAQGYALGVLGAFALTALAASTRVGRDVLGTLVAMFNPLPAIALLPLALLWFGLGTGSLVFVLVHSVLWPLALSTFAGFEAVPQTLRMAGRNLGLRGPRYVVQLLVPAALPSILSGLKIAWAFAWRTLIAAELVFGATSGQGGLGWYIFQNRNELYTDKVFAGLAMVIVLGLLVEVVVFSGLERLTVRRWGMQRS